MIKTYYVFNIFIRTTEKKIFKFFFFLFNQNDSVILLLLLDNGGRGVKLFNTWKLKFFRLNDKACKSLCQHRICIIYKENSKCNMHVNRPNATEEMKRIFKFISTLTLVIFWFTKLLYDCWSESFVTLKHAQLKLWSKQLNNNSTHT